MTTPNLAIILGGLDVLATKIDVGMLSAALVRETSRTSTLQRHQDASLWLLAHFICLHRLKKGNGEEPNFLRALSIQLSSSSNDIIGRIGATDPASLEESASADDESEKEVPPPLPAFVKDELLSLVNEASITSLLTKFNIDYAKESPSGTEDASLLASYALTLLRLFPRRSDEIRMWLYRGSMSTTSGSEIPALKFFWQAMNQTHTFASIRDDSKAALALLRPHTRAAVTQSVSGDPTRDREWRTILLFLELYTFVLRFTDDEEFLNGSESDPEEVNTYTSRIRASALPLKDVKRLTIFLKNLAFTAYYNAGELSDDGQQVMPGGLGAYFGTAATSVFKSQGPDEITKPVATRPFAGIAGMTFNYVTTSTLR